MEPGSHCAHGRTYLPEFQHKPTRCICIVSFFVSVIRFISFSQSFKGTCIYANTESNMHERKNRTIYNSSTICIILVFYCDHSSIVQHLKHIYIYIIVPTSLSACKTIVHLWDLVFFYFLLGKSSFYLPIIALISNYKQFNIHCPSRIFSR